MAMEVVTVVSRVVLLFTVVAASSGRLLQSGSNTSSETSSSPVTKVKPFPCSQHSGPLQTLWGKQGYELNERTLSGNYTVYDIPRSRTDPPYLRINACGINPIDDILHCIINVSISATDETEVPYLVRIDDSTIEFVAKMPAWSWTATFSSAGTYYFAANGKYYKIPKVAEMQGYADQNDCKDESQMASFASLGAGADMVVVSANFEDLDTGAAEYIMTLSDAGKLRVTRELDDGKVKSWLLQSKQFGLKPELDTNGRSYGAAWAYQNRVFFAQNLAGGMYEVLTDKIDLDAGTVVIEKIGPSFDNGATDGANCINMEIPSKYSAHCSTGSGPLGAYSAITSNDPFPPHGAINVRPSPDLLFLPSHDDTVTGYQVYLGPATLKEDGSVDSVEWHLACNLPCGVNVCRPPYGVDNSLGGNFAWRVDQLKVDGSTLQGDVWQFALMKSALYEARAVGDTYIDKKPKPYADKRHMLMRNKKQKNPQFGFLKFNLPPPSWVHPFVNVSVIKAELRLTVLSTVMKDVKVYPILGEKANFTETDVTSETGKHPGTSDYPNVFDGMQFVHAYGPIAPKKSFTVDVTDSVSMVMEMGELSPIIGFGLETSSPVSRFCAQSSDPSRRRSEGWCYPKLEILLDVGGPVSKLSEGTIPLACSKKGDFTPGPLDAMCGSTEPTFTGEPTDWREGSVITTTTTTTPTPPIVPTKEGKCRYNDHVYCPWPNSDIMCAGDQCCPDQSTCPSSEFAQAQGCNLKKYDCTAPVPANWTCRESEEILCPGTDIKCSGDTCCPNNTTCPSSSVLQAPGCGEKMVDCQAPLSADAACAIGEFVFCPANDSASGDVTLSSDEKCAGNQCCPDGSTCPSAPLAIAEGCGPKKLTCELLKWKVSFRVASIVFDKVDDDTKDLVCLLSQETLAGKAAIPSESVSCVSKAGSLIVETEVSAPGGWSQKKLDNAVESRMLSEDTRLEMEEMLSEVDGLQEASSGDMVFENVQGTRSDPTTTTTTASPASNGASPAPSGTDGGASTGGTDSGASTGGTDSGASTGGTDGPDSGGNNEVSAARAWSLLSAFAVILVSAGIMSTK